jgi:magnesium-transporting ATPase (P-type)
MMNSQQGANKRSNLDKTMNTFILYIVAFQIFCSTICAIRTARVSEVPISLVVYNALPTVMTGEKLDTQSDAILAGETFAGMFLLLNTFIPISLVVTLEVCKVF